MKIIFGTDHAGFELKNILIEYVRSLGHDVEDLGNVVLEQDDDYPDFISRVAERVSKDPTEVKGIVFGGSGQGEGIVANRYPGVRAVVYYGRAPEIITLSREHNDANILSLGARFLSIDEAQEAVKIWLNTTFSGDDRHVRRIKKIDNMSL